MIRVLLVDDDALTLELHREYVSRLDAFTVAAECTSARAALHAAQQSAGHGGFDVILLDVTMPDGSGLDVLRALRSRGITTDVIAVTGVRDADVVRHMAALGVVQYLVKPFTFALFRERMEQYLDYRGRLGQTTGQTSQAEIDALLGASRATGAIPLPKGLSTTSLDGVTALIRASSGLSATEAATALGMSRVAARRYLEHLADQGIADRAPRYRGRGRPETEYRAR